MKQIDDPVFVVDSAGELISSAGVGSKTSVLFRSQSHDLVRRTQRAAELNLEVDFHPSIKPLKAGYATEMEVLAALLSVHPGRTTILEAPQKVLDELNHLIWLNDPEKLY